MEAKGCLSAPLEQFTLLARSARGAAAAELVRRALEAPGLHVFGELLDAPNIQDLETAGHGPLLTLLRIFAFGTYRALAQAAEGALPPVTEGMRRKLRLLTLVTMAETTRLLPYSSLQQELEIASVRELEDLVIEGISCGAVGGKLDQRAQHFEVDFVTGRDIRKTDVGAIVAVLAAWGNNCDNVLATIGSQVDKVEGEHKSRIAHAEALEKKVEEVKQMVKSQPHNAH